MNNNKGCLKQFTDVANLLAIIALLLTIWQMRKNNHAQIESNVNQEVGYTMEMLLPCWEQWKELYFESQELDSFNSDFLSKVSLAQDRWNIILNALKIEEGKIPQNTVDEILSLMQKSDYEKITNKINQILAENIYKAMTDFTKRIENKREKLKKRFF